MTRGIITRGWVALACLIVGAVACESSAVSERTGTIEQADFVNGGFETGPLAPSWTVVARRNGDGAGSGITTFPPTTMAHLGLQAVAGPTINSSVVVGTNQVPSGLTGADSLRYSFLGNASAGVNIAGANANVNVMTQTATMTAADVDPSDGKIHIRMALAPVLNSPTHTPNQQPYFFIEVTNVSKGSTQLFNTFNFANQAGVGWKTAAVTPASGTVLYTDWKVIDIAPGTGGLGIGDSVRVDVVGAGCAFTAHFGEVYIDNVSTRAPIVTINVSAPQFAQSNTDLVYTVTVKNGGTAAASGVVANFTTPTATDSNTTTPLTLPATFVSINAPGIMCTAPAVGASGQVSCNVGALAPGASYSYTVTVHVPTIPGTWTAPSFVNEGTYNVATATQPSLTGGLVQSRITAASSTDLVATLSDGKSAVTYGAMNAYTLTVTNKGPTAATGVVITDTRPALLTSNGWTCVGSNGGVCGAAMGAPGNINTTADLPVNGVVTYTINTTVGAGTLNASLDYRATATPPAAINQSVAFDNVASDVDTATAGTVVLTVDKDAAGTGQGTVTSFPTGIDCGPACATAMAPFASGSTIALNAIAPLGRTFAGWGGACLAFGTNPQCTISPVAAATVSARFEQPSLSATILATSNSNLATLRPGDTVDYQITATLPFGQNSLLILTDTLPAGLDFVSSTAPTTTGTVTCVSGCATPAIVSGGTTTYNFGNVTCTTPAGCTIRVVERARVATTATKGATLVDLVDATGATQIMAPTVTVIEPVLTVSRTVTPDMGVAAGQTVTVTVTLSNTGGDADAVGAIATFPTPAGTTASNYMAGTCPAATASFAGNNSTFTFPAATTTVAAGQSCTFTYQYTLGASGYVPGQSITPAPGQVVSKDLPGASPPAKTYTTPESGMPVVRIATLPNGQPCVTGSYCTSAVCDTADSLCGYADNDGPCDATNGAAVCRSAACSASLVCEPAGGCLVDGDCTAAQFCDTSVKRCAPKAKNGDSLPTTAGHTPMLDGMCNAGAATAACLSGVCDTGDNKCGHADGQGPCDGSNATNVCRGGSCTQATGGVCGPAAAGSSGTPGGVSGSTCVGDIDCAKGLVCDTGKKQCVPGYRANGAGVEGGGFACNLHASGTSGSGFGDALLVLGAVVTGAIRRRIRRDSGRNSATI